MVKKSSSGKDRDGTKWGGASFFGRDFFKETFRSNAEAKGAAGAENAEGGKKEEEGRGFDGHRRLRRVIKRRNFYAPSF